MDNQKQETVLKLSNNQLEIVIKEYLLQENGLNEVFTIGSKSERKKPIERNGKRPTFMERYSCLITSSLRTLPPTGQTSTSPTAKGTYTPTQKWRPSSQQTQGRPLS